MKRLPSDLSKQHQLDIKQDAAILLLGVGGGGQVSLSFLLSQHRHSNPSFFLSSLPNLQSGIQDFVFMGFLITHERRRHSCKRIAKKNDQLQVILCQL